MLRAELLANVFDLTPFWGNLVSRALLDLHSWVFQNDAFVVTFAHIVHHERQRGQLTHRPRRCLLYRCNCCHFNVRKRLGLVRNLRLGWVVEGLLEVWEQRPCLKTVTEWGNKVLYWWLFLAPAIGHSFVSLQTLREALVDALDEGLILNKLVAQTVDVVWLLWQCKSLIVGRGFNRFWVILPKSLTERFPWPLSLLNMKLAFSRIRKTINHSQQVEGSLRLIYNSTLVDFIEKEHNVTFWV